MSEDGVAAVGSAAPLSAVAPAQRLEAAAQRVQYHRGLAPHASDSQGVLSTRAGRGRGG